MKKSNYLYLGVASVFVTFAVVQMFIPGLLPFSIYFFVAGASFQLALVELIKTVFQVLKIYQNSKVHLQEAGLNTCKRHISILGQTGLFQDEVDKYREYEKSFANRKPIEYFNRRIQVLGRIVDVLSIIQIISLCVTFALAVVKKIPNEMKENRIVCIFSLLTIALLFISYFISSKAEQDNEETESIIRQGSNDGEYYLNMIELLVKSTNQEDKK